MDWLLPLTTIGLFISIYQISEEYKRRNFTYKFNLFDKIFLRILALFLVSSIIFSNLFSEQVSQPYLCYSLSGGFDYCNTNLTDCYKITFSFLFSIIGFIISIIIIFYLKAKLNSNKIMQKKRFVVNSLDKLGRRQFSEVSADLELFHDGLLKSYKSPKQRYYCKYAKHIIAVIINNTIKYLTSIESWVKIFKENVTPFNEYIQDQREQQIIFRNVQTRESYFQRFFHRLRFIRNRRVSYCKLIDNYYYEITGNTEFLEYVAMNNTDLMFMLLDNKLSYCKDDVWSVIGTQLIFDKTSKLHKELDDGESGQTKILDFIFKDISKCEQWLVWKPIGEYIIQHLREQNRKDVDEYNFYEEDFQERRNNPTLYSGIKFFEIMVNQALKQNIHDHMWLMYLNFWVERILHNISYENHKNAEFSNVYEYCLYLIIACLRNWIKYAEKDESTPENDPIIESAIETMVNVMEKISSSENLRHGFKNHLQVYMIDNYFKLLAHHDQQKMSQYVNKYEDSIKKTCIYLEMNQTFIDFLKYPVEHYRDRMIWDRGIYYGPELRDSFIQFLDSLSQEPDHDVQ